MTHASLFSGIGGFDLAAEWMGWENIFHCEWNPFGQKVLKHHFPNSKSYNDITKTDFTLHAGEIDILTGGFPCQPYSSAGKRLGKADERHLFPHMLRCIKEVKPKWIVGENVRGLVSWNGGMVFNEVYDDLEREGYEVQSFLIPAAGVGAPHQRYRVWFVAYSNLYDDKSKVGRSNEQKNSISEKHRSEYNSSREFSGTNISNDVTNTLCEGHSRSTSGGIQKMEGVTALEHSKRCRSYKRDNWQHFPTQPFVCGGDDGIPTKLDNITIPKWRRESIKAYGNAIVPQVAFQIFKAINEFELMVNK